VGDKTGISWTQGDDGTAGATWNPIVSATGKGWHCVKVSDECDNCYAEGLNMFRGSMLPYMKGADGVAINVKRLLKPLQWQKPRKIFPCSMTDWMLAEVPTQWILAMLGVAMIARRHTYQFLTKRADRQQRLFSDLRKLTYAQLVDACLTSLFDLAPDAQRYIKKNPVQPGAAALQNAWIGVSVGNERGMWRAQKLADTPAFVRWLSIEPMIGGYLDFTPFLQQQPPAFQWAVFGGESGTDARRFDVGAAWAMIQDFRKARVAVWVKQLGERPYNLGSMGSIYAGMEFKGKADDPRAWPSALRIQEFPRQHV
jgi:protein gp37